jgi:hypothetical protein
MHSICVLFFVCRGEKEALKAKRLNPNRALEPVQILCVVDHLACFTLEGEAGYVKSVWQARCRQANERWTGSNANNSNI